MTIKTKCPHCNGNFEMDDQWLGEECKCPKCRKTFVVSSDPESPKPEPAPTPVRMPSVAAPSATAPSHPIPTLSTPQKVPFRPAPRANFQSDPQQEQPKGKALICPKCKKSYTVTQPGVYPCRCGTALELLENGSVNIQMVIPKHGVGFYILIGVLSLLMLVTIFIGLCFVNSQAG